MSETIGQRSSQLHVPQHVDPIEERRARRDERRVGHNRVARLMRRAGVQGVTRRRRRGTTRRNPEAQPADDLVDRKSTRTAPNQLWVADITYRRGKVFSTWRSWLMHSAVG
jgi:transposase InsO family protein